VLTAPAAEAAGIAAEVRATGLDPVVVSSESDDRGVTAAWARAQGPGTLLVGTPRVAAWRVEGLGLVVVIEEGRRAMKDRQTPTLHVRDLLRTRSVREGFSLVFAGPTPSVETIGMGAEIVPVTGRLWGLVEVLDRREEPPGGRLLLPATRQAVRAVTAEGGTTFVFAHRRDYAAALRCVSCRTLRRCSSCGSRPGGGDTCARCGTPLGPCSNCGGERFEPLGAGTGRLLDEVTGVVGAGQVSRHPGDTLVTVGTERDLADLPMRDLVVLVDADGLLLGTNYRAAEEALRIGARLAGRVRRGRRLIVQTAEPGHAVIAALRRADPLAFIRQELDARTAFGYPPAGELLVIELRDGAGDLTVHDAAIREAAGEVAVMGPMVSGEEARRWLLWGDRLTEARRALRPLVQRLRENGVTVRIDADPIDL